MFQFLGFCFLRTSQSYPNEKFLKQLNMYTTKLFIYLRKFMWSNLMLQKKQKHKYHPMLSVLVIERNEQIRMRVCILCPNDRIEAMLN